MAPKNNVSMQEWVHKMSVKRKIFMLKSRRISIHIVCHIKYEAISENTPKNLYRLRLACRKTV